MAASLQVWCLTGLLLGLLSAVGGVILLKFLGRSLRSPLEWCSVAAVTAASLWTFHPYLHDGLIGAGDSYHYTLQVADFVTQARKGVSPVLVGQSEYAFNGNVHTVRTAPYFTFLAGLLDWLTYRQYSFFILKNLTVLLSGWGAAFAAYVTVRVLAPEMRLAAVLISFLYVTCPGIVAPLVSLDMYATFMTVPWLPLFGLGIVLSLQRLEDRRPLLLTVGSLAMIWYAHPPIAAWLSPVFFGAQLLRLALIGGAPGNLWRPFAGLTLLAVLTGYVFYSVSSLRLGYSLGDAGEIRATILQHVHADWREALQPLGTAPQANHLQLGYALWVVLLLCLLNVRRTGLAGWFFASWVAALLALLFPVPFLTPRFWELVPARVLDLTNDWPAQRFYPILAAAVTIWLAMTLGRMVGTRRNRLYPALVIGLALGCGWSASELRQLHRRARELTRTADQSVSALQAQNLTLDRSSYLLFGTRPGYYSDGWMDPEFESRLLDDDLGVATTNTRAILVQQAAALNAAPWIPLAPAATLALDPAKNWLLDFNFANTTAQGEMAFSGALHRVYALPASGGPLAFGSSPEASHAIPVRAHPGWRNDIGIKSTIPSTSVKAVAFDIAQLPVRLENLTPYRARVRAPTAGYLETPQVFIPGYSAIVDGRTVAVRRSFEGLVAVPVPAGESQVTVQYPGPVGLRAVWYVSLLGFLSLPLLALRRTAAGSENTFNRDACRRYNLVAAARRVARARWMAAGAVMLALVAAVGTYSLVCSGKNNTGSLRLAFYLPRWTSQPAEPLLVTGETGAADCLYIIYTDAGHIRLGFDHWGVGGPVSDPIPVRRGPVHTIEITTGALVSNATVKTDSQAISGKNAPSGPLEVHFDGQVVWRQTSPYYPMPPGEIAIGLNPAGCSSCGPVFHGEILNAERFPASDLR